MKTSVVVLAVLSLAILVSVSGGDVVQARDVWPGPDVVAATNGLNPGEAVITWNRLAEGSYYRVGWVAQADREVGADGDAQWREGFVFADVANRGQASHLITGLTPGVEYDFVVASHDGRHARLRPPETYASLRLRQDPAYSPLFDSATAEVALSPAGGATHYRISWTTKADYDAVSDVDHDWRQSATFQGVPNRGQTSHTITGLDPATEYYVVAAPYGGETYGPLPKAQSVDWQLVTAESAWQSVAFQASEDCVAHERFRLSSDFDEEIAPYQCPGPNVTLSQYCEIFTHDPVLEALCVAAIPDELDETYWIFVPTAYTDPDAVAEQLHGRAFDELREVANRVESYRTFIVEIASQKALGERAHLERFVDFPEGVYAEPEEAVDVIGLIIDGYSLQYEQDSPEYQDLENHIQHLIENPGIYDDEPFGSQEFDAAIMAAVARTVFIGATREQVRILEELPMDPAWPIAVLGAKSVLDEKSSGDDLVTWGELLEEYHDQLVETLRFTAEIAVDFTAEVVKYKYGIPSEITSFILDNTVMAGFNIYERIHETNEFWDDLTLATVAAQAYWHTYRTTSGDVNPQAKASLLEYMEFSFYQRMYLAATNDVAQEDKIGNLGEPRPSQFTPTLLLGRDFALDRVVDSRWEPAQDFKGFRFEGVTAPQGICTDGATMWVAWEDLGAFGLAYPGRVKSFDLATKSSKPIGAFSFPQSVFVLSTPGLGVNHPRGMWCDSMELWVVDPGAKAVYPYPIPPTTANQGPSRSFHRDLDDLSDAGNANPLGIWAGEGIIWVADNNDDKIYAYNFSTKERHAEKDFDGLNLAGNNDPYGVWSDGSTMWVADREDGNVYAYDMITSNRDVTREFTLVDVPGVVSNAHPTGMSSDGAIMWVADSVESKLFAYALPDGRTAAATVPFGRHWADDFGRLNAAGNHHAEGIWLDNTTMTMWVADHDDDLIYGYDLTSKALVRTIETLKNAGNHDARGIWSNGAIMWVVDHQDDRVYAYRVSDGARVESQEFDLHKEAVLFGNQDATGIWSDGTTIWVADHLDDQLYGYDMASKSLVRTIDSLGSAGNHRAEGIWSDGTTVWVADRQDNHIYAYRLSDGERVEDLEFDTPSTAGNQDMKGIWSDGTTMWVADQDKDWIYAYHMPPLAVVLPLGNPTGLTATPTSQSGEVVLSWSPAANAEFYEVYIWKEGDTKGYYWQGSLGGDADGLTITNLEVGQTYRFWVRAGQGQSTGNPVLSEWSNVGEAIPAGTVAMPTGEAFARNAAQDFDGLIDGPWGIWSDGSTMWVSQETGKVFAYDRVTKSRVPSKEFDIPGNSTPVGLWSDGSTIWVADWTADKIFAFDLHTHARIPSQDFNNLSGEGSVFPLGIWSDGTTMWVSNYSAGKIYAYDMTTKQRVPDEDFDTLKAAGNYQPEGIWSDGVTMWVSNSHTGGRKIYGYDLTTKARVPAREFDTLSGAGQSDPKGLWSDGATMWVADKLQDKLYAYHMPPLAAIAPLGAPSGLTATPGSQSGEVLLSWSPAPNATVHWVYLVKPDGTDGRYWPHALAGDAATLTVTGLDAGETYLFLVIAGQEQADGITLWSQWSNWGQAIPAGTSPLATGEATFTAISSGASHTCGLRSNGSVACWGSNDDDQATPPAGETFSAVSSGSAHTCGLRSDGSVACWGGNEHGQATPPADEILTTISNGGSHTCGLRANGTPVCWGKNTDRTGRVVGQSTPPSGETFAAINGGGDHTCALRTNGTVRCWGSNLFGESSPPNGTVLASLSDHSYYHTCGLDAQGTAICWGISFFGVTRPPTGETFSAVGSGDRHTCGLRADGSAICWGSASDGHGRFQGKLIPPEGETFTTISVGWNHTCGITTAGAVACWGDDSQGQSTPPAELSSNTLSSTAPDLVVRSPSISSGWLHTCGLRSNGSVACWGRNDDGQAAAPAGETFTAISSGGSHMCGLRADGSAVCWGRNDYGQATPPLGETFAAISSGYDHTCGLRADGSAVCWGRNREGQLTQPLGETFAAIISGDFHTCGLRADGSAACWGANDQGQATAPAGETFTAISSAGHTCGLRADGSAVCWGWNDYGQATPPAGATFAAISSGGGHTCGLRADGSVVCWGRNDYGQATPPAGATFAAISSGTYHTCGLRADGSVVCWGRNDYGQATPPAGATFAVATAASNGKYDTDGDRLIEISSLEQLDAIRYDPDGDGISSDAAYGGAFPISAGEVVCDDCNGYELIRSLDFRDPGSYLSGSVNEAWTTGSGWQPIAGGIHSWPDNFDTTVSGYTFTATLTGNGHTVSNLYANRSSYRGVALFRHTGRSSVIRDIGLTHMNLTGGNDVGALAGFGFGKIIASYASGVISGRLSVGGLTGTNAGGITASYSRVDVQGIGHVGGLVGWNAGSIDASYAVGKVAGVWHNTGGLSGVDSGNVRAGYWDRQTSGQATSAGGEGQTTVELQAPTGYTGIYGNWNVDVDGDTLPDDPWDFGNSRQYPVLKYGGFSVAGQR